MLSACFPRGPSFDSTFIQRIIDNIPRIIDHDFLHSVVKEIQDQLIAGLELGTGNATARSGQYLAEDEQVSLNRKTLDHKMQRLDQVQKKLWTFGG